MAGEETVHAHGLACRVAGEGRGLLFIHGWAMSGRVWRYQTGHFSRSFRTVAVDLPGHGDSPAASPFSIADAAEQCAALVRDLPPKVVVVGWSLGSMVALRVASLVPEALAAVVLVGGTAKFSAAPGYDFGLDPGEVRGMDLRLRRDFVGTMTSFFRGMFAEGEVAPDLYHRIARDVVQGSPLPELSVVREGLAALAAEDLRPLLPRIATPTLLIHGAADAICPVGAAAYLAAELPSSRLEILPGLGHAPFLSRPELFNSLLDEFAAALS